MKSLKDEKLEEIFNNYVNGNLTDFYNDIKKLNKLQLLIIVYYYTNIYCDSIEGVKEFIRKISIYGIK